LHRKFGTAPSFHGNGNGNGNGNGTAKAKARRKQRHGESKGTAKAKLCCRAEVQMAQPGLSLGCEHVTSVSRGSRRPPE